jgi:hypothetical protein
LAARSHAVLDDRLLVEELLLGLPRKRNFPTLHTTTYWYYRASRAAVLGAGGQLSGPFERVGVEEQQRAILSLLELREDIGLPDARLLVPLMVEVSRRHPRLNLLNIEATAAALLISATVWLSAPSAAGVLPSVLEAEGVMWKSVAVS